jgi:hypothetical protein
MKNYFKKFSIMFVMSLILVLGCSVSAFATDNFVVGTGNLNNTAENSAKIGDKLPLSEKGWKRYDNSNSNIKYDGTWPNRTINNINYYDNTFYSTPIYTDTLTFKFYGTKLRIIAAPNINIDPSNIITIDGVDYSYNAYNNSVLLYKGLVYEKTDMDLGIHTVTIKKGTNSTNYYLILDAIDIDDIGYLSKNGE